MYEPSEELQKLLKWNTRIINKKIKECDYTMATMHAEILLAQLQEIVRVVDNENLQ